jgi:hypothetical protein
MSKNTVDILLVGAGVMSATLGMLLSRLDPGLKILMVERLSKVAGESTHSLNNAGTGHAGYCELNYTPYTRIRRTTARAYSTPHETGRIRCRYPRKELDSPTQSQLVVSEYTRLGVMNRLPPPCSPQREGKGKTASRRDCAWW